MGVLIEVYTIRCTDRGVQSVKCRHALASKFMSFEKDKGSSLTWSHWPCKDQPSSWRNEVLCRRWLKIQENSNCSLPHAGQSFLFPSAVSCRSPSKLFQLRKSYERTHSHTYACPAKKQKHTQQQRTRQAGAALQRCIHTCECKHFLTRHCLQGKLLLLLLLRTK